jgi:hypothetical protein
MAYKMKSSVPKLLGINEKLSTATVPVFEVSKLPKSIWGIANMDKTIYINKNLTKKQKKDAVEHEMEHIKQFKNGSARYDNKNVYWKPTPTSKTQIFSRSSIKPGAYNLPWESVIYKKTKTYAK